MFIRGYKLWLEMEILRNLMIQIILKVSDSLTVPLMILLILRKKYLGKKKARIVSGINVEQQNQKIVVTFH